MIDAHHHFWNPARIPQPWMTAEHAAINRAFEPVDLEPLLGHAGVTKTVLVQSAARDDDTDYMFDLVADVAWVDAVVAWVRLDDEATARARLRELVARPKLRGVRHLIHQEADPHWILRREVQGGLAAVADAGLVLDLPAEFPNHLGDVPEVARRHPGLTLVIDHLAKPPPHADGLKAWSEQLAAAAEHPNVFAKVSGLDTGVDLVTALEAALGSFGTERLLLGSDWPVCLLTASYHETVDRTVTAVRDLAGDGAAEILGGTAQRVYGLA